MPNLYPDRTDNIISTEIDRTKLNKLDNTMETGISSRGKYTFFIMLELSTKHPTPEETERFKKIHGNNADNKYTDVNSFILKIVENMNRKTSIIAMGTIRAQRKPRIALLYLTLISLTAKFISNSRYLKKFENVIFFIF